MTITENASLIEQRNLFYKKLDSVAELIKDSADRSQPIYQPVEGWITDDYPEFDSIVDGQMHTFWPHDEHDISKDINDLFTVMTEAERNSLSHVLLLFTHYEIHAGCDYWMGRIGKYFPRPAFQRIASMYAAVELNSHAPFYDQANKVLMLTTDPNFYSKWREDPVLVERMKFIEKVVSHKDDLISIAGFTFVEGSFLYTSFAYIKSYQAQECGKDLIKSFCRGINLSVGDENTHAITGAMLFRKLLEERNISEDKKAKIAEVIYEMAYNSLLIEIQVIEGIFSFGETKGITKEQLVDFAKHRIDLMLNNLGLKGLWEDSPLDTFVQSWFYKNINNLQFHDFFTGGGSEYDANRNRTLFGEVFNPKSESFLDITGKYLHLEHNTNEEKENFKNTFKEYVIFGTPSCEFCLQSKEILEAENIPFTYVDITSSKSEYAKFIEKFTNILGTKPSTVPQILSVDISSKETYIGGGTELMTSVFNLKDEVLVEEYN